MSKEFLEVGGGLADRPWRRPSWWSVSSSDDRFVNIAVHAWIRHGPFFPWAFSKKMKLRRSKQFGLERERERPGKCWREIEIASTSRQKKRSSGPEQGGGRIHGNSHSKKKLSAKESSWERTDWLSHDQSLPWKPSQLREPPHTHGSTISCGIA